MASTPPTARVEGELEDGEPYVVNRKGEREPVMFGKITDRIRNLMSAAYGLKLRRVNRVGLEKEVIARFKSGMSTVEIDQLVVDVCRALSSRHPDYSSLAARFLISNLQKRLTTTFAEVYRHLSRNPQRSRIAPGFLQLVEMFADEIEARIDYRRDYRNVGFSAATLMRSYLLRDSETGEIAELPQHMYMRVALAIQCLEPSREDEPPGGVPIREPGLLAYRLEEAFKVYNRLSEKDVSHASPTVFNSGTIMPQMSSCFQAQVDDDLKHLYQVINDTAQMSKSAGGVSITVDRMRAENALIRSSGGKSSGVTKYIRVLDTSQCYANQGGNRPGAFVIYMSPHHDDIFGFLEMPLPKGARYEQRQDGRFLKYAMWMPDRFMITLIEELQVRKRLEAGESVDADVVARAGDWHLFSPDVAPGLESVFDERTIHHPDGPGGSYTDLYNRYVREKRYRRVVKASEIMKEVIRSIGMVGDPYVLYKDHINRQSNLATKELPVVSSNLCAEVTIPCRSRSGEPEKSLYSVCNLAAVNLSNFVVPDITAPNRVRYNFADLIDAAATLANNLDKIIDLNYSPAEPCTRSNQYFRAIGIGVMGLADVFVQFGYEFGSEEAMALDAAIHACIYYGALRQSSILAQTLGSFPAYRGSATAEGLLQPDLCVRDGFLAPGWEARIETATDGLLTPAMWAELRGMVDESRGGCCRNGYVTANMPTATSSNAVGVNECFEPFTTHMYTRKTLAGEFTLLNPHLVQALEKLGLWSESVASLLERSAGSVSSWDGSDGTPNLPEGTRRLFRTAREIDQLKIVAHAASRNPFISQSQSMNSYWREIQTPRLLEFWITGWLSGLKTGSYYSYSAPAAGTQKIGARAQKASAEAAAPRTGGVCSLDGDCQSCSV